MALAIWIVIALRALTVPAPVLPLRGDRGKQPRPARVTPVGDRDVPDTSFPGAVEREAWAMGTWLRIVIEDGDRVPAAGHADSHPGAGGRARKDAEPDAAARHSAPSPRASLHAEPEAASSASALLASEAVLREVERLEHLLSTWSASSDISRINQAPPGRPVRLAPELFRLLVEAEGWAGRTGRAFDPTVGPLVDAWDLRGAGRRPAPDALRRALAAVGPGAFVLDTLSGLAERRLPNAWLDTGGFGKGAALRRAARLLRAHGVERALVDLGGQLWLAGPPDEPWAIGVAHPSRRYEVVARLEVYGASVATSGTSERRVDVDGALLGHILDPRSGTPAPRWGSVTVVSPDALEADVLATALYVMGPRDGLAWARAHTRAGVLFLEERSGRLHATWNAPMERWLVEPPPAAPPSAPLRDPSVDRTHTTKGTS